jgi:probable HAF family extracellular repeat protein
LGEAAQGSYKEKIMNSKTKTRMIVLALFTALAVPVQLAAQGQQGSDHKHHRYQLVDLGSTFGGSGTFFNPGSGNDFTQFTSVLNARSTVAGFADTSLSDPFQDLCFWDCSVVHAFQGGKNGSLTDLGALPGGGSSAPTWITANGWIAGVSENGETDPLYAGLPEFRAVLWERGKITDLGTLPQGGYQSQANSVNTVGQVVGAALNTIPDPNSMQPATFWLPAASSRGYQYQTRAFLWDQQNGMQDLGTLAGGTDAEAMLINERGEVVGNSYTSSAPSTLCAGAGFALTTGSFIWDGKMGMRSLGNLGGTCTFVADLNNRGQVLGESSLATDQFQHAFLWDSQRGMQDLGGSLGGNNTGAFVLNGEGQAVGFATLPGETIFHATLWRHVGNMVDLGTVGNDQCSYATGINAKGQVVGGSKSTCDPEGGTTRAFLWEDGSILDLNALISSGSGLYLESTYTINDQGEIAGEGSDASGSGHAFLLIPCDENHPDVEGCDYSLVDEAIATSASTPPTIQNSRPTAPGRTNLGRVPHRRMGSLPLIPHPTADSVGDPETPSSRDSAWQLEDKIAIFDRGEPATDPSSKSSCGAAQSLQSCIRLGSPCYGPGPIHCCYAAFPHHTFCSSRTGWGRCYMT